MAPRVCVSEKVRKQKQIQTIPSFHRDDITAVECVWANDKLSENNVQSELLAHESGRSARRAACHWCNEHMAASDVTHQQDAHGYRCFASGTLRHMQFINDSIRVAFMTLQVGFYWSEQTYFL